MTWKTYTLLLPLLGYLASIALAERELQGAEIVEVSIEGFDPRDVLRGQYIRYRLSTLYRLPSKERWSADAACLIPSENAPYTLSLHKKSNPPSACQHAIPIQFAREQHRYFIQQDQARSIEKIVQAGQGSISLALISKDRVVVRELLLNGEALSH